MPVLQKLSYYSLSMWALYLIVFLLSFKIPELEGEMTLKYMSVEIFKQNSIIPLVAFGLFLIDFLLYTYIILYLWNGQTQSPVVVESSEQRNIDYLTLAVSILTPLVSFGFRDYPYRYGVVLLVVFIIFGFIYIRGELYYANSTLIFFGIRLYKVSGKGLGGQEKDDIMVFSRHRLKKGDSFSYIKITDEVFYAKKMNV